MTNEQAITSLRSLRTFHNGVYALAIDMAIKALEPKIGHWIFDEILDKHYYCSECKSMGVDYWDYCPYCGAKMAEGSENK